MNVWSILAIVLTSVLGVIGVKLWGKIGKISEIIRMIFDAVEDKILDKEEIQRIWDAIREL